MKKTDLRKSKIRLASAICSFVLAIAVLFEVTYTWLIRLDTARANNININVRNGDDKLKIEDVKYITDFVDIISVYTTQTTYPTDYVEHVVSILNVADRPINVKVGGQLSSLVYNHEFYAKNPVPQTAYAGADLFSQTLWDTRDYFYANTDIKIPDNYARTFTKNYWSNYIQPMYNGFSLAIYDGANVDESLNPVGNPLLYKQPLKNSIGSIDTARFIYGFALNRIGQAGDRTVLTFRYTFEPHYYPAYLDMSLNKNLEIHNSNPFLYQEMGMKMIFSFDYA
jgi:hypothetical protein